MKDDAVVEVKLSPEEAEMFEQVDEVDKKLTELGFKVMEEKCVFYTLMMICDVSVAVFSSGFIQKKFFSLLGE